MSQTIISVFVIVASEFLPRIGINIGNEALTTTIQTLAVIGAALWIWFRRHQAGDINIVGVKK